MNNPDALLNAIVQGHRNNVAALLSSMNVNEPLIKGMTALHIAVEHMNMDIIELLIRSGADVNVQDDSGWTPLHLAIDIEVEAAIGSGNAASTIISSILLSHQANPQIQTLSGSTPISIAMERGHVNAVEMFRQFAPARLQTRNDNLI